MIKYISLFSLLAGLSSCGLMTEPQYQSAEDYQKERLTEDQKWRNEKWKLLATTLGIPHKIPSPIHYKKSLSTPSTLVSPQSYKDNINKFVVPFWASKITDSSGVLGSRLTPSKVIVIEAKELPLHLEDGSQVKINRYVLEYTFNYESQDQTYLAYVSVPKTISDKYFSQFSFPLYVAHEDDRGLTWNMLLQDVGKELLSSRVVIAPAGPGEVISEDYTPKKDPICPLFTPDHGGPTRSWQEDVFSDTALLRFFHSSEGQFETTNGIDVSPLKSIKENYSKSLMPRTLDILGLSKGGTTGALVACLFGFLNKKVLLEYKAEAEATEKIEDPSKKLDELMKLMGKYGEKIKKGNHLFVRSLVTAGAPLTFINGGFRTVIRDCVKGSIDHPVKDEDIAIKDYPGMRHIVDLFESFRYADPGTEDERTKLNNLVSEILTRDFTFMAPFLASAMPQAYFDNVRTFFNMNLKSFTFSNPVEKLNSIQPRVAFYHHKQDAFLPSTLAFAANKTIRILSENMDNFNVDRDKNYLFEDPKSKVKSGSYHLREDFWEKSKNKEGLSPREAIHKRFTLDFKFKEPEDS